MGNLLAKQHNIQEAMKYYEEALTIAREIYKEDHILIFKIYLKMAEATGYANNIDAVQRRILDSFIRSVKNIFALALQTNVMEISRDNQGRQILLRKKINRNVIDKQDEKDATWNFLSRGVVQTTQQKQMESSDEDMGFGLFD